MYIKANRDSEANQDSRKVREYMKKEEQIDKTYQYKFWCNMSIGETIFFSSKMYIRGLWKMTRICGMPFGRMSFMRILQVYWFVK